MAAKTVDRAQAGYRVWYQRVRGRALLKLEAENKDRFRAILAEEKQAEPFVAPPPEVVRCGWLIGCSGIPIVIRHHPLRGPVPACDGHED